MSRAAKLVILAERLVPGKHLGYHAFFLAMSRHHLGDTTRAREEFDRALDGVKADNWRILVGNDAHQIDELVREAPERAYDLDFFESFAAKAGWRVP